MKLERVQSSSIPEAILPEFQQNVGILEGRTNERWFFKSYTCSVDKWSKVRKKLEKSNFVILGAFQDAGIMRYKKIQQNDLNNLFFEVFQNGTSV